MNYCNNNNDDDDKQSSSIMDTLTVMCHQEMDYQAGDYMMFHYQQEEQQQESSSKKKKKKKKNGPLNHPSNDDMIDMDCRTKMVEWCYRVCDFCDFDHETVAMAMNILDRYMMTNQKNDDANHHHHHHHHPKTTTTKSKYNRRNYQLAAMTSLYMAVKIHEPEAMDPAMVANKLSHGTYTVQDVESMEFQILQSVSWRVNPPTTLSFVRLCLELIPEDDLDEFARETVYGLAKVQSELAVADYGCVTIKPSVIAYCSIMNALQCLDIDDDETISMILSHALHHHGNDTTMDDDDDDDEELYNVEDEEQMDEIQEFLYEACLQEPEAQSLLETCMNHPRHRMMTMDMVDNNNNNKRRTGPYHHHSPSISPRSTTAAANL